MQTEINRFDIWQNQLFTIIEVSHPYMLQANLLDDTTEFIISKANQAQTSFDELLDQGVNAEEARDQVRNEILLSDLKFSPTDYIASFVWEKYNREIDVTERISIYNDVKHIFEQCKVNGSIYDDAEKEEKVRAALEPFFEAQ